MVMRRSPRLNGTTRCSNQRGVVRCDLHQKRFHLVWRRHKRRALLLVKGKTLPGVAISVCCSDSTTVD